MSRPSLLAALALTVLTSPARALRTESLRNDKTVAASGVSTLNVTSGQALVRLSTGTSLAGFDGALAALGSSRGLELTGGWIIVNWNGAAPVAQQLAALRAVAGVVEAQPSRAYALRRIPNDPLVASQYALASIDAFRAWEFETGSSSRVTVAVVDSGIQSTHADLSAKLAGTTSSAFDATSGVQSANNPPTPACQHGTEVAGVAAAAADNGILVSGVSWGAQLVSYKVFNDVDCPSTDCSDNSCQTNDTALIAALAQAQTVENTPTYGRIVVNMSVGGPGACSGPLQAAITGAVNAGVTVVAAAGNSGPGANTVENPANCAGVIPAGASDSGDRIAGFSSRGVELSSGVVAPGVAVLTTNEGGGTSSPSGTSFSSPMTAGVAALILAAKPSFSPAQVRTALRAGADNIGSPATDQGAGRLNAYKSVYYAINNGALPAPNAVNTEVKPFAYPNPLKLSQTAGAVISVPSSLKGGTIKIYTLDGQIVRTLTSPLWNGRNDGGKLVATGTYVFTVTVGSKSSSGRMAVIR